MLLRRKPARSEVLGGREVPQQLFDAFYLSIADFDKAVTPLLLRRGSLNIYKVSSSYSNSSIVNLAY